MREIRLIKLLRSFTREELKAFGKFVSSPTFTSPPVKTILLYDHLIKFYPDFNSPELNKQEIFQKLFGGEEIQ